MKHGGDGVNVEEASSNLRETNSFNPSGGSFRRWKIGERAITCSTQSLPQADFHHEKIRSRRICQGTPISFGTLPEGIIYRRLQQNGFLRLDKAFCIRFHCSRRNSETFVHFTDVKQHFGFGRNHCFQSFQPRLVRQAEMTLPRFHHFSFRYGQLIDAKQRIGAYRIERDAHNLQMGDYRRIRGSAHYHYIHLTFSSLRAIRSIASGTIF